MAFGGNLENFPNFMQELIVVASQDIPELERAFKDLGKVMYEAVVLLSKQIDKLVSNRIPAYLIVKFQYKNNIFTFSIYKDKTLSSEMENTKKLKGRLLYYYPTSKVADEG